MRVSVTRAPNRSAIHPLGTSKTAYANVKARIVAHRGALRALRAALPRGRRRAGGCRPRLALAAARRHRADHRPADDGPIDDERPRGAQNQPAITSAGRNARSMTIAGGKS